MCCLASQGYPSPSFKSNIFPSGWILGSGLVSLRIYSIWGGLRCGLLLGSCGWILGSGFVSLRIYIILRWAPVWAPPGLLWAPAMFLWEFTVFQVGSGVGSCGFQRRFHENLQPLRWAPVWAPGLLWVPATFLWEFTAFCAPQACSGGRAGGV